MKRLGILAAISVILGLSAVAADDAKLEAKAQKLIPKLRDGRIL